MTPLSTAQDVAVWKTIKLGTCKSPDEYREALKKVGRRIGDWGGDILGKTDCAREEVEIDLVVFSAKELDFANLSQRKDICAKALQLGLELCPAEVGPALRLAYGDQPDGEWLYIAMEAVTGSNGDLHIFAVGRNGDKLWLISYEGHPEYFWLADYRFVFLRRKQNFGFGYLGSLSL